MIVSLESLDSETNDAKLGELDLVFPGKLLSRRFVREMLECPEVGCYYMYLLQKERCPRILKNW